MKYPKFIQPGNTIGFVAPSFGAAIEPYRTRFNAALERFQVAGFKVDLGPNVYEGSGVGISNTPAACAAELADYYAGLSEHHGDVLISVGGGELMCETLGALAEIDAQGQPCKSGNSTALDAIAAANPKWFLGYSDNTHFGFLLATMFDTASIYGPNAPDFGMQPWHESIQDCWDLLTGKTNISHGYDKWELVSADTQANPLAPFNLTEPTQLSFDQWDQTAIEGRFVGGCLDVLNNMCGTRFDEVREFNKRYATEGVIWFIEACEYGPMEIRRSLWHLRQAGWFENAKAFVFGRPGCISQGADAYGLTSHNAVTTALEGLQVPIIMDADFGHVSPAMPMINGGYGRITPYNVPGNNNPNIQIEWDFTR